MITQERLKELLHYEEATGVFTWKVARRGEVKCGVEAGCIYSNGYRVIKIAGKRYGAHRLAWLYVHGAFPTDEIDHINHIKDDNSIVNLREATRKQNAENIPSKSAHRGVSFDHKRKKFVASIYTNGKSIMLGRFYDLADAVAAYKLAAKTYHTHNPEAV